MRSLLLLAVIVHFGCDDGLLDELPDTQNMAACLAPSGTATLPVSPEPVVVTVTGVVSASGTGLAPDGCFDGPGASRWGAPAGDLAWFRLADADNQTDVWTVGVALRHVDRISEGRTVSFDYRFDFGGFAPAIGSLVVSDDRGERLWIGLGGDVGDLRLPEALTEVERGPVVYRQEDDCGTWEAFELDVRTAADGWVNVEYGESEDHGNANLYHGGYRHDRGKSSCPDWFVAEVNLAWQRD